MFYFLSQELRSELEFIQSLSKDLHQRCQALPLEVPDIERREIKGKLERLQREISDLDEKVACVSRHNAVITPEREGASAFVDHLAEVVESKPPAHEPGENGDSDLGDSESGVSSMESFEGILRKENDHMPGENGIKENGVSEEHSANDDTNEDVLLNEGVSVSPDEYQRIRSNHSAELETNGDATLNPSGLENGEYSRNIKDESRVGSRETSDKSRGASVPLVMVTNEDGSPVEVAFAENFLQNSSDNVDNESFPGQAGEFFIDDFDVYYGQAPCAIVVEPNETSASKNAVVSESEKDEPDLARENIATNSRADDTANRSQNRSVIDQIPSGVVDDHTNGEILKDIVKDHQLTQNAVPEITLPSYKNVPDDMIHEFDISADLQTGDDHPRHSTPSELVASTAKEENSPRDSYTKGLNSKPELLNDYSAPVGNLVNGDAISYASNKTQILSQLDEGKGRSDKRRKYEPAKSPNSTLGSSPTKSSVQTGQTGLQSGLVNSAANEEMDKLDRLLNISELDVEVEKPQDRIATILSERRKAEEAERLRFAENSVRDTDYELFTSRPLDFVDRSSPLKDLDESGTLLHEEMSLEEFLVEVEKLVEKLRSIEELITTDLDSEDNVKDELAKHVVSWKKFCYGNGFSNTMPLPPKRSKFKITYLVLISEGVNEIPSRGLSNEISCGVISKDYSPSKGHTRQTIYTTGLKLKIS